MDHREGGWHTKVVGALEGGRSEALRTMQWQLQWMQPCSWCTDELSLLQDDSEGGGVIPFARKHSSHPARRQTHPQGVGEVYIATHCLCIKAVRAMIRLTAAMTHWALSNSSSGPVTEEKQSVSLSRRPTHTR